jgi:hypothetical protein
MSLTVAQIYSVRFGTKLSLPKSVQDNIAKLRIVPVAFKPLRQPLQKHVQPRHKQTGVPDNWREKVLAEYVSKLRDKDGDPDYYEVFGNLNKVAPANLSKLSSDTSAIILKRDEQFRLRVSTLMFNKAITEPTFSSVIADFAKILVETSPEIVEDLHTQIMLFPKLYDTAETITYPTSDDPDFDNKVVKWFGQKEKRRGYSKFMTQLFVRSLVSEEVIHNSIKHVVEDLNETARQKHTSMSEENTTHLVDFLFECGKALPVTSTKLRTLLCESAKECLKVPRPELPSLCMRSRFKLEDLVKCVQ